VRACVLAALLLVLPAPARADDDVARAAQDFATGEAAYEAGDYRRAAEAFEAAYRAKAHHAPLWNAARSWEKAGENVRAANLLERYLREAPADAPDRDNATATLADVQKRLGRLQIQKVGVTGVRVDGAPFDEDVVYVAPGEHVATADAGGVPVRKLVRVAAGDVLSVTLSPPPPEPPAPEKHGLSPWYVVAGGALVATGLGFTIASGFDTVSKRDAFLADPTQPRLDEAFHSQTRTNVLLATTGGIALVTAVLAAFFVEWRPSPRQP
jgi:tetratricopeptide (TPR) repeat protein